MPRPLSWLPRLHDPSVGWELRPVALRSARPPDALRALAPRRAEAARTAAHGPSRNRQAGRARGARQVRRRVARGRGCPRLPEAGSSVQSVTHKNSARWQRPSNDSSRCSKRTISSASLKQSRHPLLSPRMSARCDGVCRPTTPRYLHEIPSC